MLDALSATQKVYLHSLQEDPGFPELIRALLPSRELRYRPRSNEKLEDLSYESGRLDERALIVQLLTNDRSR